MSDDQEKLAAMVQAGAETAKPKLAIRDPYVFEFLGLRAKDAVAETDLEAALVENLRDFLVELGHGSSDSWKTNAASLEATHDREQPHERILGIRDAHTWYIEQRWAKVLGEVLERVYLARCQLVPGPPPTEAS